MDVYHKASLLIAKLYRFYHNIPVSIKKQAFLPGLLGVQIFSPGFSEHKKIHALALHKVIFS
jgi:hypothetical protein